MTHAGGIWLEAFRARVSLRGYAYVALTRALLSLAALLFSICLYG